MHNYKIDNEITNKVLATYNSKVSDSDMQKLIKDIVKVKDTFTVADIPDYEEPNFERLPEVNKSADDITQEAEKSLSAYKHETLTDIDNTYNKGVKKIQETKQDLNISNDKAKASLAEYYIDAKQKTNDNAINNGVTRSSIVINQLDAFDREEIESYNTLDKELSDNLNALDFELNSLQLQKSQALENFDIAYAVKLSDKITKLNNELIEEQNKVIKYNNEIADKEKKYLDNYNELVSEIQNSNVDKDVKVMDLISKYGYSAVDKYKKSKLYEVLDNYFANKTTEEIANLINGNEDLKNALGNDLQDILDRYK